MTADEAPDRQPGTEQDTMALKCLQSVGRAGRVETASRAEPRAHAIAVAPDQEREHPDHEDLVSIFAMSVRRNPLPVTRMRISRLPKIACLRRNHSRSKRFIRFRSTARGNKRLGTMRASLGAPSAFALRETLKSGSFAGRPPLSKAATSVARSRCQRRKRSLKR